MLNSERTALTASAEFRSLQTARKGTLMNICKKFMKSPGSSAPSAILRTSATAVPNLRTSGSTTASQSGSTTPKQPATPVGASDTPGISSTVQVTPSPATLATPSTAPESPTSPAPPTTPPASPASSVTPTTPTSPPTTSASPATPSPVPPSLSTQSSPSTVVSSPQVSTSASSLPAPSSAPALS